MKESNWKRALNREERGELKQLDRDIELMEAKDDSRLDARRKLAFLKYQRKVIQNRSTIRAKRAMADA